MVDESRQGAQIASRARIAGLEEANVVCSISFEVAAEVRVEAGHGRGTFHCIARADPRWDVEVEAHTACLVVLFAGA